MKITYLQFRARMNTSFTITTSDKLRRLLIEDGRSWTAFRRKDGFEYAPINKVSLVSLPKSHRDEAIVTGVNLFRGR